MKITNGAKKLRLSQMTKSRDYHRTRAAALAAQVRELKDDRRIGFQEGLAVATLSAYLAVAADYDLPGVSWLSERIQALGKNPPRSNEIDELVTRDVLTSMQKYSPQRAAEVEREFQKFLAGDSK